VVQTTIFQFGTSRFLQAHADLFISEANGPKISVIASSGGAQGRARLAALSSKEGYPVLIRGVENGEFVERREIVSSIAHSFEASEDWLTLIAKFVDEAEFVISNTSERGFYVPEVYIPHLQQILREAPEWFPAKLFALLYARFLANRKPLILLPTELVGRNGDTLKSILLELAARSGVGAQFIEWLGTQSIFANSLVDRIVSQPIEPAGAIAEPYALWAVEMQPGLRMPCAHASIKIVPDLIPYERLKIHILNLGHSVLAERWQVEALDADLTVRAMLADPARLVMLEALYADEVIPGFAAHGLEREAQDYVCVTLERFQNPFLDHRLADIAGGHGEKVRRRVRDFLSWIPQDSTYPTPVLAALSAKYS
jgi:tagaturonate reductase